ncbi:MAG: hypothetical protein ACREN2_06075 [Candidatus Dormibacteria bacterium]
MTFYAAVTVADVLDAVRLLGPSSVWRLARHLELVLDGWVLWDQMRDVVDDLVDSDELVVRTECRRGADVRVLALPAMSRARR